MRSIFCHILCWSWVKLFSNRYATLDSLGAYELDYLSLFYASACWHIFYLFEFIHRNVEQLIFLAYFFFIADMNDCTHSVKIIY